jgi:hypothetical protein
MRRKKVFKYFGECQLLRYLIIFSVPPKKLRQKVVRLNYGGNLTAEVIIVKEHTLTRLLIDLARWGNVRVGVMAGL